MVTDGYVEGFLNWAPTVAQRGEFLGTSVWSANAQDIRVSLTIKNARFFTSFKIAFIKLATCQSFQCCFSNIYSYKISSVQKEVMNFCPTQNDKNCVISEDSICLQDFISSIRGFDFCPTQSYSAKWVFYLFHSFQSLIRSRDPQVLKNNVRCGNHSIKDSSDQSLISHELISVQKEVYFDCFALHKITFLMWVLNCFHSLKYLSEVICNLLYKHNIRCD